MSEIVVTKRLQVSVYCDACGDNLGGNCGITLDRDSDAGISRVVVSVKPCAICAGFPEAPSAGAHG